MTTPTPAEAHAMGRFGPNLPPEELEAERLAFEAWKQNRLLRVVKTDKYVNPFTQMQWIAWRDRAALAHHAAGAETGR